MRPPAKLSDAALAVGVVVYETARVPLGLVERLPGMRRLAAEGASRGCGCARRWRGA